jgi:hypothetical protein
MTASAKLSPLFHAYVHLNFQGWHGRAPAPRPLRTSTWMAISHYHGAQPTFRYHPRGTSTSQPPVSQRMQSRHRQWTTATTFSTIWPDLALMMPDGAVHQSQSVLLVPTSAILLNFSASHMAPLSLARFLSAARCSAESRNIDARSCKISGSAGTDPDRLMLSITLLSPHLRVVISSCFFF